MGTHPIFESDFDCLTEKRNRKMDLDASFIDEFLSDNCIDANEFGSLLHEADSSSSDDGFSGSSSFSPESSPPQQVYQSPSGSSGSYASSDLKLDDLLCLPDHFAIDEIIHNHQPHTAPPPPPVRKVVRSAPYEVRKIEKPVKIIGHANNVKRIKPPMKEQRIHSTPKCQIIKIEPQDETKLIQQKSTVVVKVEPQPAPIVTQPYQAQNVFARPNDIVSQAWNSSVVSSGMDDRGRIIKRTQAQMKAEERKIRNRQSASQSRERKKQMAERMELDNKRMIIEHENQKARIVELENRVKYLEAENKRILANWRRDQSKNVSVTAGALFSLAIVGYLLTPLSTPISSSDLSTDLSIPHTGRKLMSFHYHQEEEEKALALRRERRDEIELSATDYWLDDTLQGLRNNVDLVTMIKLASDGPVTIQRIIRRKLYEEFGIKIGRVPDLRRRNAQLPSSATKLRLRMPQVPPRMRHGMCSNTVENGDALHKVLESWKMPKEILEETGLIKPTQWIERDLLRSLSPLQFIMPPDLNNTDSGPRMTVVMPTGDTNLSNEHLTMIQIDCVVTGTKSIALSRPLDHVEHDEDEVRVEIEV